MIEPMSTNKTRVAVLLSGLCLAGAVVYWASHGLQTSSPEPSDVSLTSRGLRPAWTQVGSAEGTDPAEPRSAPGTASHAGPLPSATPAASLPPAVEELLTRRPDRIRATEVPSLDESAEAALLRRYEQADGLTNRYRIIRILVLGETRQVTPLIARALTNDYAGMEVGDGAALLHNLPNLLGFVATYDDDALAFLLRGIQPGFWEQYSSWQYKGESWSSRSLRVVCVQGLGLCLREEAKAALFGLRTDPERAVASDIQSALVDAAWRRDSVLEHGVKGFWDLHRTHSDALKAYEAWMRSPNGQEWMRWYEPLRHRSPDP
jgi:hypothetical protein